MSFPGLGFEMRWRRHIYVTGVNGNLKEKFGLHGRTANGQLRAWVTPPVEGLGSRWSWSLAKINLSRIDQGFESTREAAVAAVEQAVEGYSRWRSSLPKEEIPMPESSVIHFATLLENDGLHKFSCAMAMVEAGQGRKRFLDFTKKIKDEDLAEDGREDDPHITILDGLHTKDSNTVEQALKATGVTSVKMKLKGLSLFPPKHGREVLKIEVESEDLATLNKTLIKLPHTTDYPNYNPHLTLAYIKEGRASKYLKEDDPFKNLSLTTSTVLFSTPEKAKTTIHL